MPQHPRVSISLVKRWARDDNTYIVKEDLEALLMTLVAVDATLVRHGRVDQARAIRRDVARLTGG